MVSVCLFVFPHKSEQDMISIMSEQEIISIIYVRFMRLANSNAED